MIKECNFKREDNDRIMVSRVDYIICGLNTNFKLRCSGEEDCILFQIYKRGCVK